MNKAVRFDTKKLYSPRYNSECAKKNAERKEMSDSSQIFLRSGSTFSGKRAGIKRKKALKKTFVNTVGLVAVSCIIIFLMWMTFLVIGKAFDALLALPTWILITVFGAILFAGAKALMK